ncbi:MAG: hypothetical protein A3B38_01360 [Candidatus Levybacteria bacterium RIFCSPLOWO2_01_FULL_36_13]|nr:MAG: hypothetical protein A2684_02595 [Candidatus Levybacteria bacterium RIFCSPHIGHO2_01_FULL_36_15b]OGH35524.1 MAG: hypothetical protein A3B38_01360 [Candidatus Levybacteria bacterium RIFCSPLOWO2_01_FULL_36_13]
MLQGMHQHLHKKPVSLFDHIMYIVAFLGPLFTIPQFLQVWTKQDVAGLSFTTWGAYTISSFLWLFYWKEHHKTWIFFSQILIFTLNLGIVSGIWYFGGK